MLTDIIDKIFLVPIPTEKGLLFHIEREQNAKRIATRAAKVDRQLIRDFPKRRCVFYRARSLVAFQGL